MRIIAIRVMWTFLLFLSSTTSYALANKVDLQVINVRTAKLCKDAEYKNCMKFRDGEQIDNFLSDNRRSTSALFSLYLKKGHKQLLDLKSADSLLRQIRDYTAQQATGRTAFLIFDFGEIQTSTITIVRKISGQPDRTTLVTEPVERVVTYYNLNKIDPLTSQVKFELSIGKKMITFAFIGH